MSHKTRRRRSATHGPHSSELAVCAASDAWPALILRIAAVFAQAATIAITWPLWQVRHFVPSPFPDEYPNLPALPLPQFDMGVALFVSLVLVLFVPRWGVILHGTLLLYAILLDQMRIQPECVSLFLLMLGTLDSPSLKMLARSHLIALWFFAGYHKLVSPGYYEGAVPFMMLQAQGPGLALGWKALGALAALFEMALGLFAIVPRTRRLCAVLAGPFHVGVAAWLYFHLEWNDSVCPWNLALAVAGFTLIWTWRTTAREDWRQAPGWLKGAVAFVLFSPLLFYVGMIDPFLAHCVYSNNTPKAWIMISGDDTKNDISSILVRLNVAIPPEHRLFEAYFNQVASPGDKLIIEDPRWWASLDGYDHREIEKPYPDSDQ